MFEIASMLFSSSSLSSSMQDVEGSARVGLPRAPRAGVFAAERFLDKSGGRDLADGIRVDLTISELAGLEETGVVFFVELDLGGVVSCDRSLVVLVRGRGAN